jgi:hypothetical protein
MLELWVTSILTPIAPRSKSTITALPIHIKRISFFSVFRPFGVAIDFSSFGRTRVRWPQARHPGPRPNFISRAGRGAATVICNIHAGHESALAYSDNGDAARAERGARGHRHRTSSAIYCFTEHPAATTVMVVLPGASTTAKSTTGAAAEASTSRSRMDMSLS